MDKFKWKKASKETAEVGEKIAVGLDIGTTKVVAFVGRRNESGKVEIMGHGETISVGVQRGQVINITKTVIAINHAIKQACASSGVTIDTVLAGIADQHINSFHSKEEIKRKNPDDVVTAKDIRQLVDEVFRLSVAPGTKIIDAIPQEFFVDNYRNLIDPIGVTGTQFGSNFNVITDNEQHIKNIVRCVRQCDLEMEGLILEPLASSAAVLDEREKESGVALVDIGGGTTDVAVYYDGILRHTAVIPIGGDVITDDIKAVFQGIVKEDAEKIKLEYGSCVVDKSKENLIITIPGIHSRPPIEVHKNELAEVIAARMDEILDRVTVELQTSDYMERLGCGIVLTGGGALMKDIKAYAEYKTGMTVRIGYPEEKVIFEENTRQKYNSPIYSTALGLMVMSLEKPEDGENPDLMEEYGKEQEGDEQEAPVRPKAGDGSRYRPWNKIKDLIKNTLLVDESEDDEEEYK